MGKGANVVAVAAAGFIAGMLLAPKSGKETRQDIIDKAHDAKKAASDKAAHMKERMHKIQKDVGSEVSEFADSTKRRFGKVMNEEKDMMHEAKTRTDRASGKVSSTVEQEMQADLDKKRLG